MAISNENVITQVRRRSSGGFDAPFPIGTSAKYITGVRGTNVNNIEEQFLLGYDCITTIENLENGEQHIVQEFRTDTITSHYYIVDIRNYSNTGAAKQFLEDNSLFVPNDIEDNRFDEQEGSNSVTFVGINNEVYAIAENELNIKAQSKFDEPYVSIAQLYYQGETGSERLHVADKITYYATIREGSTTQKQVIKNYLQ